MEVALIRWPAEADRRAALADGDAPRLLLLEAGASPPEVVDCLEDWIRVPAADADLRARVRALEARTHRHLRLVPDLDVYGVLRFGNAWVSLPPVEARLVDALIERFGAVVGRDTLRRSVWPGSSPGRNVLDVHVLRLRRRLAPLGLVIRTVRSRGYMLEAEEALSLVQASSGDPPS